MTSLALPNFDLTPPIGMIEELCQVRETVLSNYRSVLETHRQIEHAECSFPVILDRNFGYGANIDRSMEGLTKQVDGRLWVQAIEKCQFGVLMNQDDRDELLHGVKDNPVPFTRENAIATLLARYESAADTFVHGLVSLFKTLDRNYKSNQGWDIGKRIIVNHYHEGRLNDLQRILMLLNGEKPQALNYDELLAEVVKREAYSGVMQGETPLLRWRRFLNGNTHVWVTRRDLLDFANLIIAKHYGASLGQPV